MPAIFNNSILRLDIFYVAFAIWCIPELIGFFTQRPGPDAQVHNRGSRIILMGLMWVGIFSAFWSASRMRSAEIAFARLPIFWIGIALMLAGTAFRWYAIRTLGAYFTRDVATRPDQQVIQNGPYRLIRHPSYTGGLMALLGTGLALGNWIGLATIVLLPLSAYLYRMGIEERALVEAIGQPYRDYMSRTRRLIPFVY